ncbi:MAG: PQQ-binding-like beta-propeller repeat protein [Methanobacteriota archaeon]
MFRLPGKLLSILLVLGLFSTGVTTVFADDWPMFRHDPQHTGYSPTQGPSMTQILWNTTISPVVSSSPAFGLGRLYIGSEDGYLYCFDADPSEGTPEGIPDLAGASCDLIWKFHTGGAIRSSPAFYDGRMYFGSSDGKVYCIYACIGTEIWNYSTGSPVSSSPTVVDGRIYIGSENGKVYCLNAETGAHNWEYLTGGPVRSSPAVVNDRVFIGSDDHQVYCLFASNGSRVWRYMTGGNVGSSPTVVADRVYVGSEDYRIYSLNATTGLVNWSYRTDGRVFSSPAVFNGKLYIGSDDAKLYCFFASNGSGIWKNETESGIRSSPAVADGKVYVGSDDRYVYCYNIMDGSMIWRYAMDSAPVSCSPAVSNLRVFVAAENGHLVCIRNHNPPNVPEMPRGPTAGLIGETYRYHTKTSDPELDQIYYKFNWGDGNESGWRGPFGQLDTVNTTYKWKSEGTYNITVKAKDHYGYESDWSIPLTVHMMILSVDHLRGGLGFHAEINNLGTRKIWDIYWNISINGGRILNPVNSYYDGDIEQLASGETVPIRTGPFFELGKIRITVTISDKDHENAMKQTVNAFAFGYILFVLPW